MYNDVLMHKFATVSFDGLEVTLDSRLSHQKVCSKIRELDTNSHNTDVAYSGISGGQVKMKAAEFSIAFSMTTRKYLRVTSMVVEGPLYFAR